MTFPSSSTSEFLYIYVLFSKRTRFESTRNTRRLAMHRPVMHCFREAIPPAPALRCSAEPRRARFQPSAPVTPWESEFAYRKSRSRIDPRSSPVIRYFVTSFFPPPPTFLPSFLPFFRKYYFTRKRTLEKLKFRPFLTYGFVHCFVTRVRNSKRWRIMLRMKRKKFYRRNVYLIPNKLRTTLSLPLPPSLRKNPHQPYEVSQDTDRRGNSWKRQRQKKT